MFMHRYIYEGVGFIWGKEYNKKTVNWLKNYRRFKSAVARMRSPTAGHESNTAGFSGVSDVNTHFSPGLAITGEHPGSLVIKPVVRPLRSTGVLDIT